MNRHLTSVMIAALAAAGLFAAPAFADHRPGNVVVMGGTLQLTGPPAARRARVERVHNARKLYVDELNARGGLLGHRVEYKIYDIKKADKRTAIELYEKLITEDKVDLVLGPYGSLTADSVANVMERYKQPFVAYASKASIYERGRKYIFSIPMVYAPDRAKSALHVAKKIGVKRVALISQTGTTNLLVLVGAQEWAKKLGLKVVFSERYESKFFGQRQTDFGALLPRIEASGAEAIIANSAMPESVAQLRQLRDLNINVKMFAALRDAETPEFVKELGSTAEYVVGFSYWEPNPALGHPGLKEFVENYEKRYGEKPEFHASAGYAMMQITEAAVKAAGGFDPEKVRTALASISVETIRGTYKANEQGMSHMEPLAIQIQNGKHVLVWPEHVAEATFIPMPKWEDRAKK